MTARPTVRTRSQAVFIIAVLTLASCAGTDDTSTTTFPSATASTAATTVDATTTLVSSTTAAPAPTTTTPTTTAAASTTANPTTTIGSSTTTTATSATTTTVLAAASDTTCASTLPLRDQVGLLVWPSVYSTDWSTAMSTVTEQPIGGVLLMRPDGWTPDDLTRNLADLEAQSRRGLIVATDEEGGDVQRLRLLGELASQRNVSTSMEPAAAAELIAAHGEAVRATGVDMVLGPVVDVEPNVGEVPLSPSRFFVGDPSVVTDYASAYIDGWTRADLLTTLKHYPGHGAASGDTHITAGVTPSLEDIDGWDLAPYRALAASSRSGDVSVMIGHLTVPGLTDGVPATRSAAAIDYLRDDLGYGDALLITDALGMAAVGLAEPEASVLALQAGIDIVIFTQTSQTGPVIDALVAAVESGQIDAGHVERAAGKVLDLLARDGHTC